MPAASSTRYYRPLYLHGLALTVLGHTAFTVDAGCLASLCSGFGVAATSAVSEQVRCPDQPIMGRPLESDDVST
jgi:hypothetical protein